MKNMLFAFLLLPTISFGAVPKDVHIKCTFTDENRNYYQFRGMLFDNKVLNAILETPGEAIRRNSVQLAVYNYAHAEIYNFKKDEGASKSLSYTVKFDHHALNKMVAEKRTDLPISAYLNIKNGRIMFSVVDKTIPGTCKINFQERMDSY